MIKRIWMIVWGWCLCAAIVVAAPSFTLVIDAGHGGKDPQSRLPRLPSAEVQYRLFYSNQALLRVDGVQVVQVRAAGDFDMDALM